MTTYADIEEGFDGKKEWAPVDEVFRKKAVAVVESVEAESVLEIIDFREELTLVVRKEKIRAICQALRDDAELRFDYLTDVTAIDYLLQDREPRFEVIYHLYSISKAYRLRLRCPVAEDDCCIDSVVEVWAGANYNERETFDFFGIIFNDHPNLERIMLPDEFEGHPMRKDFPIGGTKSFYFKKSTQPFVGEPKDLIPRIRPTGKSDI